MLFVDFSFKQNKQKFMKVLLNKHNLVKLSVKSSFCVICHILSCYLEVILTD